VHHLTDPLVRANATLHSYATAYWWSAAFFALGAILTVLLFRRKGGRPAAATGAGSRGSRPLAGANGERQPSVAGAPAPVLGAGGRLTPSAHGEGGR
jgi:hypothetical protein